MRKANIVGVFKGERITKTVENVFLKLIVTIYFRKAVYKQHLLFLGMLL